MYCHGASVLDACASFVLCSSLFSVSKYDVCPRKLEQQRCIDRRQLNRTKTTSILISISSKRRHLHLSSYERNIETALVCMRLPRGYPTIAMARNGWNEKQAVPVAPAYPDLTLQSLARHAPTSIYLRCADHISNPHSKSCVPKPATIFEGSWFIGA